MAQQCCNASDGLVLRPAARVAQELQYLGWNVPPDEIQHIPEHWLSQLEPPASLHYMLGIFYIFLFFMSTIGNGLVIWIFSTSKPLRTPSNLFVLNLAVFDFIMCAKAPIFIYNSFRRGFALGNTGCQIFAAVGAYSGIGAGMTNAAIGYDRYNVITRPMERSMTFTKALLMNIFIWLYCTPWVVLPLTEFWDRFVPEGYLTSCTFDYLTDNFDTRLFVATIFFFSFVCPTTMIVYYYSQIVGHVFSHEKALREQAKKMNVESLRSNVDKNKETAEIRIAKAAITICFLFFVSWTPYGVMSLIGAFGDKSLLTPGVTMIPACTCKMVACVDPFVYAISHPRYRLELQKRCPWLAINEKAPEAASTASTTTQEQTQTTAAVLLFPPVNNYRRFLIHQSCEELRQKYNLFTFSIGQGLQRRTVVCFKNQLLDPTKFAEQAEAAHFENRSKSTYEPPLRNWRSGRLVKDSTSAYPNTKGTSYQKKRTAAEIFDKMGVEKKPNNYCVEKANTLNIYRPPALRNHNFVAAANNDDDTTQNATITNAANAAAGGNSSTSTTNTTTLRTADIAKEPTSIICDKRQNMATANANTNTNANAMTSRSNDVNDVQQKQQQQEQQQQAKETCETVAAEGGAKGMQLTNGAEQQRQQTTARRQRRPDRAVYIPRARRSQTTPPAQTITANGTTTTTTNTAIATATATTATGTATCNQQQLPIAAVQLNSVSACSSSKADEADNKQNATTATTIIKKTKITAGASGGNKLTKERKERSIKKITTTTAANAAASQEKPTDVPIETPSRVTNIGTAAAGGAAINTHINCDSLQRQQQQQREEAEEALTETEIAFNNCILQQKQEQPDAEAVKRIDNLKQQQQELQEKEQREVFQVFDKAKQTLTELIAGPEQNLHTAPVGAPKPATTTMDKKKSSKMAALKNQQQMDMSKWRIEDIAAQENLSNGKSKKCDNDEQELQRASKEINRSNRRIIKQTFVSDVLEIPEKIESLTPSADVQSATTVKSHSASNHTNTNTTKTNKHNNKRTESTTEEEEEEEAEDDWEAMYDESGECLDPKVMQELTAAVGKVKLQLPKLDYSAFQRKQSILSEEEFPHVLEVSNFPVEFKNQDLLMLFSQYKESGFDIKWVDDTHALAVFSSSRIAAEALTLGHPFVKLKPLAEATAESRLKAKRCASSLQPYRQRPETCAALARRLVTGALGVRLKTAAAERENEKRVLREAKERKLLLAKQRDEAWEN